jgi:outer membrane cobalamin receptor
VRRFAIGLALAALGGCARGLAPGSRTVGEPSSAAHIVSVEAIERSGARTAWEALQRTVPGYVFSADGHHVSHRGRTSLVLPDRPLIILDGVRLQDFSLLSAMPASDLLAIQVLSGIDATTYYGTNAGAGAILITTKDGDS